MDELFRSSPAARLKFYDLQNIKSLDSVIKILKEQIDAKQMQGERGDVGQKGEKGDQGEPGRDGKTPLRGIDYFTKEDIAYMVDFIMRNIPVPKDGKTPVKGIDYTDGKDGSSPEVDYEFIFDTILEHLPVAEKGEKGEPGEVPIHIGPRMPKNPQKGDFWIKI